MDSDRLRAAATQARTDAQQQANVDLVAATQAAAQVRSQAKADAEVEFIKAQAATRKTYAYDLSTAHQVQAVDDAEAFVTYSNAVALAQKVATKAQADVDYDAAVDLAARNMIWVYPVTGWWRERTHLGKCGAKARYGLVATITCPDADIDLYTPIEAMVETLAAVEIEA